MLRERANAGAELAGSNERASERRLSVFPLRMCAASGRAFAVRESSYGGVPLLILIVHLRLCPRPRLVVALVVEMLATLASTSTIVIVVVVFE